MADGEKVDYPFRAEYSPSARAGCKKCKEKIAKDDLRMAIMVQSPFFDGKMANWFHFNCFFTRTRIKSVGDIAHFTALRWEDQERIRAKIEGEPSSEPSTSNGSKAKGKKSKAAATKSSEFADFSVEYAKSARSVCKLCEENILKDVVRISKLDYESDKAKRFGPLPTWYHVSCFVSARQELEFFGSGDQLPGFKTLGVEDQGEVKSKLKKIAGKRKMEETEVDAPPPAKKAADNGNADKLKKQNELFYKCRDQLEGVVSKKELIEFLEENDQYVPTGEPKLLDQVSDILTFGALDSCKECKDGRFLYSGDGYRCHGNISDWTKCQVITKTPARHAAKIPEEFMEYQVFKKYKYVKRPRLFHENLAPTKPKSEVDGAPAKLLQNCTIAIVGKIDSKDEVTKKLVNLGAKVGTKVDANTLFVISTEEEAQKGKKLLKAKANDVFVVSAKIVDDLEKCQKDALEATIRNHSLCQWGGGLTAKVNKSSLKSGKSTKSEDTTYTKSVPNKMRMMVKGSAAVDPESNLEDRAHILEENGSVYNAILGQVDISRGSNSYYKLQLLASDQGNYYWVFRAWGRVGTTIGGNKCEPFPTKLTAIMEFKRLYEEKTGNDWSNRQNFQKMPNRMYPLEIDYGQDEGSTKNVALKAGSGSKLPLSVQELICLIFDVEQMKKAMLEFEIDLKKMPLGKLSKRQIEKAYQVLTELQELLKDGGNANKFLDASNRFYTLIPHDFGMKTPTILDSAELIKSKVDMLDNLLEIEVAYNMLQSADSTGEDPVDSNYKKLNTDIGVIEKDSKEFQLVQEYVKNTHASTHAQYTLDLEEVYKIDRKGESKRFKPFKKLHNRQLLWHGSRLTNFAGILSQGLRIAPPEAPATGYMFGKGIYFADMVSKSANYCCTSKQNPVGILLLCEVALGNMYERSNADYITKLPPQMHSTKGVGRTHPDPKVKTILEDGLEVPHGTPVQNSNVHATSLLYNEYIVYDTAQVNIKYLLKTKFNWKY